MVTISKNFKIILQIATVSFFLFSAGNIHADERLSNISVRPENQNRTIDFFIDALYWHTGETVDWAFTLTQGQNFEKSSFKTFSFDWDPGFRIGLGYNMKHDQWDTQASYTWFQSKAKDHTNGSVTPAFLAARLSLLEPFSTGKARLNIHYNMFDWDLGKNFLPSEFLSLRPSIGLKGGWITQSIHSKWTIPNLLGFFLFTASENLKQSFRGGGPKAAVTGQFCFGNIRKHSLSLIGYFEAGYLWGNWSIQDKFADDLLTNIYIKTLDRNFGSFELNCLLGLGWDINFDHDRSHFGLKIGYEIIDWLNQLQIFSDASGSQNNDLILQGLNLSLRFDF